MAGKLTGKTAVVTGGSTGIGQEIARRLAAEGADIAVADVDPADETRELVAETGRRFLSDKVDISDEEAIHGFAARVRSELGAADILVNNAAVVLLADFEHVTLDQWRRTFAVNVDGAFLASKAFLPDLKASGSGRIVNITSSSYWTAPPPFVSYISAKGALNGFTSVLAANLAAHGITVNGVAAGLVRTAAAVENTSEAFFEQAVQIQDIKRVQMPTDVSGVVAFLASEDASFITGQIIVADGGSTRR
ncbi:(S)-1-Phenylethanol dehydrogenase [Streptomyces graminofaciens]|uniref:(S)-1-Phenylethanol dehydrogenase n=1 Tax=Streptomyces graminofaciens TaxID=68212 RepID=A0ABN5V812_9ACTN|nr:SDR family oxidoreductase [Streptomyces graminofaciens]BBC28805.1 (S)-1-Phenylethanol dehydrogenase [Streptomyces graminofaciens]